jgi:hypothetical protein
MLTPFYPVKIYIQLIMAQWLHSLNLEEFGRKWTWLASVHLLDKLGNNKTHQSEEGRKNTRVLNFERLHIIFVGPRYRICFMSPSWHLQF